MIYAIASYIFLSISIIYIYIHRLHPIHHIPYINHRNQPLIRQLNAILGAPSWFIRENPSISGWFNLGVALFQESPFISVDYIHYIPCMVGKPTDFAAFHCSSVFSPSAAAASGWQSPDRCLGGRGIPWQKWQRENGKIYIPFIDSMVDLVETSTIDWMIYPLKWRFSIVMLVYQRIIMGKLDPHGTIIGIHGIIIGIIIIDGVTLRKPRNQTWLAGEWDDFFSYKAPFSLGTFQHFPATFDYQGSTGFFFTNKHGGFSKQNGGLTGMSRGYLDKLYALVSPAPWPAGKSPWPKGRFTWENHWYTHMPKSLQCLRLTAIPNQNARRNPCPGTDFAKPLSPLEPLALTSLDQTIMVLFVFDRIPSERRFQPAFFRGYCWRPQTKTWSRPFS